MGVSVEDHNENKQTMASQLSSEDQDVSKTQPVKRKKKVIKRWREEWADTRRWAYVDMKDGTARIFCSVCQEYGRKHRRNPYGNEGSRNMLMSALEEHNNSLLHKEALRLQMASKDKIIVDKPIYVKDSKGYLVDEGGFDFMKINFLRDIKAQQRSLRDYSKTYARSKYYDEAKPWSKRCDIAFPCSSQNEVAQSDAVNLVKSGCPVDVTRKANVLVAPSTATGVGGEVIKHAYQKALKAATDYSYQKESPELEDLNQEIDGLDRLKNFTSSAPKGVMMSSMPQQDLYTHITIY